MNFNPLPMPNVDPVSSAQAMERYEDALIRSNMVQKNIADTNGVAESTPIPSQSANQSSSQSASAKERVQNLSFHTTAGAYFRAQKQQQHQDKIAAPPPSMPQPLVTPPQPKTEMEFLLERHLHNRSPSAQSVRSGISAQSTESERSVRSCHSDSGNHGTSGSGCLSQISTSSTSRRKKPCTEDPMSHRIIEKRRRDRMNNCLADLSRLIPSSYLKKGRGRIEKTEIIEMAIKHMKHLHLHSNCRSIEKCELSRAINKAQEASKASCGTVTPSSDEKSLLDSELTSAPKVPMEKHVESFRIGYHECLSEVMHFLVEKEGMYARDSICVRLMSHLQRHYEKLSRVKSNRQQQGSTRMDASPTGSVSSSASAFSRSVASKSSTVTYGSTRLPGTGHPGSSLHNQSSSDSSRPATNGYTSQPDVGSASDSDYGSFRASGVTSETPSEAGFCSQNNSNQSSKKDSQNEGPEPFPQTDQEESVRSYSPTYEGDEDPMDVIDKPSNLDQPENLSTHSLDADRDNAANYKFKKNMRLRFSDEYHHPEDISQGPPKRQRLQSFGESSGPELKGEDDSSTSTRVKHEQPGSEEDTEGFSSHRSHFKEQSHQSPLRLKAFADFAMESGANDEDCKQPHVGPFLSQPGISHGPSRSIHGSNSKPAVNVPIFALHPRGTFYVPLSIDHALIAPKLFVFGGGDEVSSKKASSSPSMLLHPVTINVSFCRPAHSSSLCGPNSHSSSKEASRGGQGSD